MPSSTRKSSIGATRRGLLKAHIPYRGDNPEVGKKTGITVQHVRRKSDGFEPFDEVLQQADKRTPPKVKGRKNKQPITLLDNDLDENGEMSMELDDSPLQYFANARQSLTPLHPSRVASSSRPVSRTSDIDFDKVPSPKPRARKSIGHGFRPGPSNLSNSIHARDLDQDQDPPEDHHSQGGIDDSGFNEDDMQDGDSPNQGSPRRTSFLQMDQDDDDDDNDDGQILGEGSPLQASPINRHKMNAALSEAPEEGEREDAHPPFNDEVQSSLKKKAKLVKGRGKREDRHGGKLKNGNENGPVPEGERRSARERYKPLEWWRGERLVYGRGQEFSGPVLVAPVREIVRIPRDDPEPLQKRKRKIRRRSKSMIRHIVPAVDPEEGWDDDTTESCIVLNYPEREEVQRRVAMTAKTVKLLPAANSNWSFQKVFGDADFIAAGQLVIPPHGRKPSKGTKDNTYIFYVIEGAVNLRVHDTSLILATGAMFMVPRGNTYFIENIADRDAKLFFTQARKVTPSEEELASQPLRLPDTKQQVRRATRSSSTGSATAGASQVNGSEGSKMLKRTASTRM